jgi:hypothetical protein
LELREPDTDPRSSAGDRPARINIKVQFHYSQIFKVQTECYKLEELKAQKLLECHQLQSQRSTNCRTD